MKRLLLCLLTLSLILTIPLALFGCGKEGSVNYKKYNPSKYKEGIEKIDSSGSLLSFEDDSEYTLVFEDNFDGELNTSIWGDTRQGTRRDGYWTKNLAYTDGAGHLVIRTETRGSRYCSDTLQRTVAGYNGSEVVLTYDDCYPFGMVAGDFGPTAEIHHHTTDLVGNVILAQFDDLGTKFSAFTSAVSGSELSASDLHAAYKPFFDTALELYSYYAFVRAVKTVDTSLEKSAVIGINYDRTTAFGAPQADSLRSAVARLYGFESEADFILCAQSLADLSASYKADAANCAEKEAFENGCFLAANGNAIFPIAIRNESTILVTYVIVEGNGQVSVWVNDAAQMLRAINYGYDYYSGVTVNNETFCKNILFVSGPEGVYSGAIRTMDLYTHGFGYYEIRCKLPDTVGIWHAFWMMCGDVYNEENGSTDGIEIDVFEYLPARDAINCALHWDGYDEAHKNAHQRFETVGCADDEYHLFGMKWDEAGYTFYIDRQKVWTSKGGGICPNEGYMIISTEYGEWGDWVGELDPDFEPVDWIIDYVRVYDKK